MAPTNVEIKKDNNILREYWRRSCEKHLFRRTKIKHKIAKLKTSIVKKSDR